jgi:protein SCO1/2
MSAARRLGALLLVLASVLALPAAAQEAPQETDAAPSPERARAIEAAQRYFTDVELVNQYGEPMRLYSDLLRDKVVIINTIFTTCTGICPVMSKAFETIQERVGDRLGEDVHLISISVDPENDTPERMQVWGEAFHARRGWYLVTGDPENVAFALQKLGQYVEDPESHQAIMLMGNDRTGLWKKAFGLAGAEKLLEVFDSVLNDPGAGGEGLAGGAGAGR